MVFRLDDRIAFPDPKLGEKDGLLAVGGDLSVDRLLLAYSYGIFPWSDFRRGDLLWWCPLDRFVIFPGEIHISHSMRQLLRKDYTATFNRCFDRVIHACSEVDGRNKERGAWLGPNIIEAYTRLHEQNLCQSVEIWKGNPEDEELVGGLYGVTIGRCFMGESMFSFAPSGSKLALITLARYMSQHGGLMIDCQFETPHLLSMGGRHISYDEYLKILQTE